MCPTSIDDFEEFDGGNDAAERGASSPTMRLGRRKTNQRTRAQARRARSNDMAKRGMHQRRNKRIKW